MSAHTTHRPSIAPTAHTYMIAPPTRQRCHQSATRTRRAPLLESHCQTIHRRRQPRRSRQTRPCSPRFVRRPCWLCATKPHTTQAPAEADCVQGARERGVNLMMLDDPSNFRLGAALKISDGASAVFVLLVCVPEVSRRCGCGRCVCAFCWQCGRAVGGGGGFRLPATKAVASPCPLEPDCTAVCRPAAPATQPPLAPSQPRPQCCREPYLSPREPPALCRRWCRVLCRAPLASPSSAVQL